jgi:hypothetical protein
MEAERALCCAATLFEPSGWDKNQRSLGQFVFTRPSVSGQIPFLGHTEIEARSVWRRDLWSVLKPIVAKKYRLASVIAIVRREAGVRYFIFSSVHPKGGLPKRCCGLIPPAQSNFFPPVPILVGKMDPRRQTLFWTFEKYFDSGTGGRSVSVTLEHSFAGEAPSVVQEGFQRLTRGIVPAGMDDAKAGKIEPDGKVPEPIDGILMGGRVLSNLDEEFGVLVRVLRRMTPQERTVLALGRPPYRVKFVISHHRFRFAGVTHRASNSQDLSLLWATVYEITNEDHLLFWVLENTLDFDVIECAQQAMQRISVTMYVTNEIVFLKRHRVVLPCRESRALPAAGAETWRLLTRCQLVGIRASRNDRLDKHRRERRASNRYLWRCPISAPEAHSPQARPDCRYIAKMSREF